MNRSIAAVAAALALSAVAASASAATTVTINGLVNTGLGAAGTQDTNFQLSAVSDPVLTGSYGYITSDSAWPINPWMANDSTSKWITPTSNQAQSFDPSVSGVYTFHTQFNLSGFDATTAAISGRFSADNAAVVLLNGQAIGTGTGFTSWSSFASSGGFTTGLNTLDFVVTNYAQNGGNPIGLRVEFSNASVAAAVPEPETYAMMLAGIGLVGWVGRRKAAKGARAS